MAIIEFFIIIIATLILTSSLGFLITNLVNLRIFDDFLDNLFVNIGVGLSTLSLLAYLFTYLSIDINLVSIGVILIILSFMNSIFRKNIDISFKLKSRHLYIILCLITYLFLISKSIILGEIPGSTDLTFHSVYVDMIIEDSSIPKNWDFFDSPIRYTLGSHSIVAIISLFTGYNPIRSSLVVSCFFSMYFVASVYLFSKYISKNREIALFSLISMGFLISFGGASAFHWIYWGGIAELCGLSLIPIIFIIYLHAQEKKDIKSAILCGIMVGALILIHPLSCIYLFCGILPFELYYLKKTRYRIKYLALVIVIASFISASYLERNFQTFLQEDNDEKKAWQEDHFNSKISQLPRYAIVIWEPFKTFFVIFGSINFIKKSDYEKISILWIITLSVFVFISYIPIKFPGYYYFIPYRFLQVQGIPIAILMSRGLYSAKRYVINFQSKTLYGVFYVTLVAFSSPLVFFADVKDPLSESDQKAMRWLKEEIDENEVIMNDNVGLWIPAISDREILLPHMPASDDMYYYDMRQNLYSEIRKNPDSESLLSNLSALNVSYVYISKATSIDYHYEKLILNKTKLNLSDNYQLIYQKNDIYIFKIIY